MSNSVPPPLPPADWRPRPCRIFGRYQRFVADVTHPPVLVAALRHWLPDLAWSKVRALIDGRRVMIGGGLCLDEGRKLSPGELVDVFEAPLPSPPKAADVRLLHVDRDVVVAEKPARMLTLRHPAEARWPPRRKQLQPTFEEALCELLPGRDKPPLYSVHRIDRDTSGLLVFARHETAQQALISQFAAHDVARDYLAIVPGRVEPQTIRSMLVRDRGDGLRGSSTNDGGMEAVTRVQPARCLRAEATPEAAAYQELQCTLETGRTHQIRIHLAELGNPVCGDWMYRNRFGAPAIPDLSDAPRLALHAGGLGFQHPTTGAVLRFESTWPSEMQRWIARLQGAPNSVGRTAASESQRQRGQSRRQPGKSGSSSPTRGRKRKS